MKAKNTAFILCFLLLLFLNNAISQTGFQLSMIKPSGDFSYTFKPGIGFEIHERLNESDDRIHYGVSVSFFTLKTLKDTIPVYAIKYDYNNGYTLLPGWEVIKKYMVVSAGVTSEALILSNKLTPIAGMDLYFTYISFTDIYHIETLIDSYSDEDAICASILPKVGILYKFNDYFHIETGIGKNLTFMSSGSIHQQYWKIFIDFTYYFE